MSFTRFTTRTFQLSVAALCLLAAGCNAESQPTAAGKVQLPANTQFAFAGDTLELRSVDKPTQIAFGQIQPDGSFKIESLAGGEVIPGAPAGTYQARLVIADDDIDHKKQAAKAIPKKYLRFDTSPLKVDVPSSNLSLTLAQ